MDVSVVFASDKQGFLGFCIDFKNLNVINVRGPYTFPRIHECINSIGGKLVFSKQDAIYSYFLVQIDYADPKYQSLPRAMDCKGME